jgi:DNA-binding transcriptional MerR regulator
MLAPLPVKLFTIGEVSRALNKTPRTIRYWEDHGRIPLAHRDNVTRRRFWTEADVRDLQLMVYGDALDALAAR